MILRAFLVSFFSPWILFASWADDLLAQMTLDEKIGQLFVMPVCPKWGEDHFEDLLKLMRECHIGNVIVKQSDPITQVKFLNRLQEASDMPLLVTADAEWGLSMRMSDTIVYPRNMTLGAIQDLSLLQKFGAEIGRQAKLVGIHLNLAPVADVNNNPFNPVIHMRSFGEDPYRVADCVAAVASGMRMSGLFACAKHFPGHGDTYVDSHRDLPVIGHDKKRLETVEFVPFQRAIDEGLDALMTAHLYVPAIDDQYPTSLSYTCLRIAREMLHFKGLIISDALNMKAVSDRFSPQQVALFARAAGCDLLLYGDHIRPNINQILRDTIPQAFAALKKAYMARKLSTEELDQTVFKILQMKEKLETKSATDGRVLMESLHTEGALQLKETLFQEAVTLLGDADFPIPKDTAYISFGSGDVLASEFESISPELASCVIIAVHQKEALTSEAFAVIEKYREKAILCHFATPYALIGLKGVKTILIGYENDPVAQKAVLSVLLGINKAKGKLPVTVV